MRQEREGRKKWGREKESVPLLVTTTFQDPPLLTSTCCSEKDSQLQQLEGTKEGFYVWSLPRCQKWRRHVSGSYRVVAPMHLLHILTSSVDCAGLATKLQRFRSNDVLRSFCTVFLKYCF